jgi:hypothetical protein
VRFSAHFSLHGVPVVVCPGPVRAPPSQQGASPDWEVAGWGLWYVQWHGKGAGQAHEVGARDQAILLYLSVEVTRYCEPPNSPMQSYIMQDDPADCSLSLRHHLLLPCS